MPRPQYGTDHQRRRRQWARALKLSPIQCGCPGDCGTHPGQCPIILRDGMAWHLGHGIPAAHGGDGSDATPWCPLCNLRAGSRLAHHPPHASQEWFA